MGHPEFDQVTNQVKTKKKAINKNQQNTLEFGKYLITGENYNCYVQV